MCSNLYYSIPLLMMNCAGVWKPASNVGGTFLGPEVTGKSGKTALTEIKLSLSLRC